MTFPKSVGQIPLAFPMKPGSDSNGDIRVAHVLYPFGYGLSYTDFEYSDLKLDNDRISPADSVKVSFTVTNTGRRKGDEVAQLYVRDDLSSVTTYNKVLRGFERITLEPGESRRVEMTLVPRHLGLINRDNKFVVEPGTFTLTVGGSSVDDRLKTTLTVTE